MPDINVRCSPYLKRRLQERAKAEGVLPSVLVRRFVTQGLSRKRPTNQGTDRPGRYLRGVEDDMR